MLVGAEAAVFVVLMMMLFLGLDGGQGQQGEGQGKQQAAHGGSPARQNLPLRYNKCLQPASAVGALRIRSWRSWTCCAYVDRSATGRWT
ncbi:hypothetical protein D3C85_695410 [compost metagenome]